VSLKRRQHQRAAARAALIGAAVVVPIAVGAAFGASVRRVLVPESLMLVFVVAVTLVGGTVPGILAALSATASLWFFNLPPGASFRLTHSDDTVTVILTGLIAVGLVFLLSELQRRDRRATVERTSLEIDVRVQRRAISTMQRALMPQILPVVPAITIGSYYQTGGEDDAPVGGDWFAFIPLSSTRLGIAIGDVAGHGLPAVTAMAEYRYAMRVIAPQSPDPATVLERFEALTAIYRRDIFTSCVYGVIDVREGTFTFTSAGHPSPLVVRSGRAEPLAAGPHGPVVGIDQTVRYGSSSERLKKDDFIVLYTDGLVERRGENLDVGIDRLCGRVADLSPSDLDMQCEQIVLDLVGAISEDDAAIVVAHYEGPAD
jgi:serine phosphatase RsbU (regulator of sigma subunit)